MERARTMTREGKSQVKGDGKGTVNAWVMATAMKRGNITKDHKERRLIGRQRQEQGQQKCIGDQSKGPRQGHE